MSELAKISKALGPGPATYPKGTLERKPGKQNWVDRAGGLPRYIERIAGHLHYEKGMSIGHAIATAVNAVKKMCATGDLNWRGVQNVNAGSRAAACAAVADWERKKASARVSKGVLGRKWSDDEFIAFLTNECGDEIAKALGECHRCEMERKKKKKPKVKKRFVSAKERKDSKTPTYPGTTAFPVKNQAMFNDAWGLRGNSNIPKDKVEAWLRRLAKKNGYSIPGETSKSFAISDEEFEDLTEEFNADGEGDEVEFSALGEIEKRDDEQQMVFGWCSIAKKKDGTVVVDKQGDVLEDIDQMEHVAYDFVLNSRDGGEMHVRKGVSTLVESFVSTPEKWEAMGIPEGVLPTGWWVGFKVNDKEVWKAVKAGKYKQFSVHGSGLRKVMEDA